MSFDEDYIALIVPHEHASRLARLFRQCAASLTEANNDDTNESRALDELALALGTHMNICSNTDNQDLLDEKLDIGDTIDVRIYDSHSMNDHVTPIEANIVFSPSNR